MIDLVTPIDFDKLTDDVLYLGNKMMLRLNVILARQNLKDKTRIFHHKEYMYDSKYIDKQSVGTLRRSFQYFLTIDKLDSYESNVMIRPQDMILLVSRLTEVSKWFCDGTFAFKDNELIILSKPNSIVISGLNEGKFIMFDPIVIDNEDGIQEQGVRLTISRMDTYVDMSIDRFYALLYTLKNFNMFESAQLLVNYLGRPKLGELMYNYSGISDDYYEPYSDSITCKNRDVRNKANRKSYFDKPNSEDGGIKNEK